MQNAFPAALPATMPRTGIRLTGEPAVDHFTWYPGASLENRVAPGRIIIFVYAVRNRTNVKKELWKQKKQ